MQIAEWVFHRGHGVEFRGVGTEAQARRYLKRLNAGRTTRTYVLRQQLGILDLSAELAKLEAENA